MVTHAIFCFEDANVKIATEDQFLTQTQACSLYQKLMDAGLLQNGKRAFKTVICINIVEKLLCNGAE